MATLKEGDKGDEVTDLQEKLHKLGYTMIKASGTFDPVTAWAVRHLQATFGYTIDAIVGAATTKLIDKQVGYGWSIRQENALERALRSQNLL